MPEKCNFHRISIVDSAHGYLDPGSHKSIGSFTTYLLRTEHPDGSVEESRRRYSEFELLHSHLIRKYPDCVVPPIPEKHSLLETVVMYTLIVKKDVKTVDKRKRLLSSFLNNVAQSADLKDDRVFLLFLQDSLQWSEEVLKLTIEPNLCPPLVGNLAQIIHKYDFIDQRLVEQEKTFAQYEKAITQLEETERKRIKKFDDVYDALCELGCSYNAFSLEYESPITNCLAVTGESIDADAKVLHDCIVASEAYCDQLHEQRLFCGEAGRLILYIASMAVKCDSLTKAQCMKRAQFLSLETTGGSTSRDSLDACEEQLNTLDREKAICEADYSRILAKGLDSLQKLRSNMMLTLKEIITSGITAMINYHSKNAKVYLKTTTSSSNALVADKGK